MKRLSFALAVMILAVTGCQDRHFVNVDNTPGGNAAGVPTESINSFAKDRNLSEAEAAKYLRSGQRLSRQIATDPPVDSRVTRTSMPTLGPAAEPFGEAIATDAPSGSLEPPQSDFGSSMIRTTGGYGAKMY